MTETRVGGNIIRLGSREELDKARGQAFQTPARDFQTPAREYTRPDYSRGEYDEQTMKRLSNLLPYLKEKKFQVTLSQGVQDQTITIEGKDSLGRQRKFIGRLHPGRGEVTVDYRTLRHIMNIALRGWRV